MSGSDGDSDPGARPTTGSDSTEVVVYWRPGCAFCGRLLRWIDRNQVAVQRHNIWEDPDAADAVRAITGGDETVPTVVIGTLQLVNPSPRALSTALGTHAPHLLPTSHPEAAPGARGRVRRLLPGAGPRRPPR